MALDPHGLHRPDGAPLRTLEQAFADRLARASNAYVLTAAFAERGPLQVLALAEIRRRGLVLTQDQREQAGLPREESDHVP